MNKKIFIAALATLATGSVMAQSSVTLYGRVSPTIERVKIGSEKVTELRDNASFFGFKGVEDLGGGLKASFLLEAQFNTDDGRAGTAANQGGSFFGRESWVALGSESLGRIRLGNPSFTAFYYATADYIGQHNFDTGSSADAFFLYVGNVKNTVGYTTPEFFGATIEVQYGLGEKAATGTGQDTAGNTRTIALQYNNGPFHAGAGYTQGPLTQLGRLFSSSSVAFASDIPGTSVDPLNKSTSYGARALYEFSENFNIGGYVNRDELDDGDDSYKRTSFRVSSKYTMGAFDAILDVGHTNDFSSTDETGADQYTINFNYNLSKRTRIYTYYTRVENDDNIYYGPGFNNGATGGEGDNFSSFAIGIRHLF